MSVSKFVSEVKTIAEPETAVFDFLSDFEKISSLFDTASGTMPEEEKAKITSQIENWSATKDDCSFQIKGVGETGLKIVNREPCKTIKYEADKRSPFPLTLWIQLVKTSDTETKMRVTLHAELNTMMKMMLKSKLTGGVNQFAEALTRIPYSSLA